jgi:hypothetical protein
MWRSSHRPRRLRRCWKGRRAIVGELVGSRQPLRPEGERQPQSRAPRQPRIASVPTHGSFRAYSNSTVEETLHRFSYRPDPSVRGLGSARLLFLSRPLGSRYRKATVPIVPPTRGRDCRRPPELCAPHTRRLLRPPARGASLNGRSGLAAWLRRIHTTRGPEAAPLLQRTRRGALRRDPVPSCAARVGAGDGRLG